MAKEKPQYEAVDEFNILAEQIVEKYPHVFPEIETNKIRCVKITNKTRPEAKAKLYELVSVKMPMLMDSPYGWYVTLWGNDWDEFSPSQKLALICNILKGVGEEEGKVVPFDTHGYGLLYRTFGNIDYLEDPNLPNILEKDIEWAIGETIVDFHNDQEETEDN